MDLRQLEYFESVARNSSFTKAAQELNVSQPTISVAIKKMEEDLGVPLFVRDKRKVMLTYEGDFFYNKITTILKNVDDVILDMRDLSQNIQFTLNIGILPNSGAFLYEILFKRQWQNNQKINYKIIEMGSYGVLEALKNEEIDIGYIIINSQLEKDYNIIKAREGEVKLLVSKDHPFAQYEEISVQLLNNQNFIQYPSHSYIGTIIDNLRKDFDLNFNIIASPTQMMTIYDLVQKNIGIALGLGDSYVSLSNSTNIVGIPLNPPIKYKTGFVWKKDKVLSKSAKMLISYVNNN